MVLLSRRQPLHMGAKSKLAETKVSKGAISMTVTVIDWVSLAFGVIGLVFGLYQIRAMRTQSDLYREKCSIRYKDVSETVSNLTEHLIASCETIKADCITKSGPCGVLSANVTAAMSLARELIRFCKRLDEEYAAEFKKPIDLTVAQQLEDINCRCIDVPSYNPPETTSKSAEG